MSKSRGGVAELQSALVIAVISLSMAYVVYSQARFPHSSDPVFVNETQLLDGSPSLLRVQINASRAVDLRNVLIDSASAEGVLTFDGSSYSASQNLCLAASTTFFSVFVRSPGRLAVLTDGRSWIAGSWSPSAPVQEGWNEVIISGGSYCSIALPDGSTVDSTGTGVSRVPLTGALNATSFTMFVPWIAGGHAVILVFAGGTDRFEA